MSDDSGPEIFVPPPFMFGCAIAAGVLVDGNALEWRHVTHPSQFVGVGIALAGLVLIFVTLGLFRRFRTRPEPWQPSTTLIRGGIYRLSRNPMYLGMAILSAGVALFFESIAAFVLLAATILVMDRYVIAREEAYLTRRFGSDYDDYRKRVRRWL
jgi:protein-S-isoprenylcysteine O-methyltransferase Ste14